MAYRENLRDEMGAIETKYALTQEQKDRAKKLVAKDRSAEIIVLFQNGIAPRKGADPTIHSIPKFYPRVNPVSVGQVTVQRSIAQPVGSKAPASVIEATPLVAQTVVLHDIQSTAMQNLDEKWGGILVKKIAGAVAKEAIGNVVANKTNNPALGAILKLAMHATDQADTRSWQLLPKDLQIARIQVSEGTHTVNLKPVGGVALPEKTVQVKRGQKVFVSFRYIP